MKLCLEERSFILGRDAAKLPDEYCKDFYNIGLDIFHVTLYFMTERQGLLANVDPFSRKNDDKSVEKTAKNMKAIYIEAQEHYEIYKNIITRFPILKEHMVDNAMIIERTYSDIEKVAKSFDRKPSEKQ